jgi:putative membrane protein
VNDTQLRDELAVERTRLANERTWLAYVRTALALAAGGAGLLQFFPDRGLVRAAAWALITAGGLCLLFGTARSIAVHRKLLAAIR